MKQLELKKLELEKLEVDYKLINEECLLLRKKFKLSHPPRCCPVYLARSPDRSHTPLVWRYSSTLRGRKGMRPKVEDFWSVIQKLNESDKQSLIEFEYERFSLNYKLAMIVYQIGRLQQFISDYETWTIHLKQN